MRHAIIPHICVKDRWRHTHVHVHVDIMHVHAAHVYADLRLNVFFSYVVPTWINQRDIPKEIWRVADLVEYNLKWYNCECYPNQTPIKSTEGFIDKPTILCLSISPARFNICKELMTTDRRVRIVSLGLTLTDRHINKFRMNY